MSNPLVDQGVLNRLRASVIWNDFPELNVTASYLGDEAIRLALEGEATTFVNTMTGAVTSPEPYQAVSLTMALLKTQGLGDLYKRKMERSTLLGQGTVRPDASPLSPYSLFNCAIGNVRELSFGGRDPGYVVTVKGYYIINSDMWAA